MSTNTQDNTHPAVWANMQSIKFAQSKEKDKWLALYRDDAVLADPVGISPFDPEGKGHIGKAGIEKFWDAVIANSNIVLTPGTRCTSGQYTCAVPMRADNDLGDGVKTYVDMIAVYEVDEQGLIKSMKAYWSWDAMEQQLKKFGLM